jgi:hypothetical protein
MPDLSKPPICAGECIRCGRIAFTHWYCDFCLAKPRYVNRMPKKPAVVKCICGCDHPVKWKLELEATG